MHGLSFHERLRHYRQELLPWGIGLLIVVLGIGVVRQALKRYQVQRQIDAMEQAVDELHTRNGQLAELLTYVKSPAYTEEQARLRFGFGKPGERLAIVPEGSVLGATTTTDPNQTATPNNQPNHWKWWNYFFPEPK